MTPSPNPRRLPATKINTDVSRKNGEIAQQGPITTPDLRAHLERLQGVSIVASKIFTLLGEQITSVSSTIPVQRGHEAVGDLKVRANAHREGLKTALDPLREQLDQMKAGFWDKNREILEASVRKYVKEKIKDRILAEVNKKLKDYLSYLKKREAIRKLEEVAEIHRARTQNSLLCSKYPDEHIAWFGTLPEGTGQAISLGQLINAERPLMIVLAASLGLSPAKEADRIDLLNKTLRYLGIRYQGLPARAGVLLMPTTTNL